MFVVDLIGGVLIVFVVLLNCCYVGEVYEVCGVVVFYMYGIDVFGELKCSVVFFDEGVGI